MIGTSPKFGKAGYLAAILAVWCLLIAGGMSTHAPQADDHVHVHTSSGSPEDGHSHFNPEKTQDICTGLVHCGADLLALSAETAIVDTLTEAVRDDREEQGPAKRVYLIEPPPPRLFS